MTIVRSVLARVFVDDVDLALPTYQMLSGEAEVRRFGFRDVDLAWVGPFLLLDVPPEQRADYERVATLLVGDIDEASAAVRLTREWAEKVSADIADARAAWDQAHQAE